MVREKYNLDKSYFHLSDPDCYQHLGQNCSCKCNEYEFMKEVKKHFELLLNKNTINFLFYSTYKPNYNFYSFFNDYEKTLNNKKYDSNNFCIDNGGILSAYGLRDAHDLDFLYINDNFIDNNFIDNNIINNNISCENKNHRKEYEILGYSIENIINNNYFYHFGVKFMSINLLKKFKFNRTHTIGTGHNKIRKKDINDYRLITEHIIC